MSVEKFKPEYDQESNLIHESKPYTQIMNFVLQNFTHEPVALAVWCHLQSLPINWKVNVQYISNKFNIGRDKAYATLRILEENKLLSYVQKINKDGTFGNSDIIVLCGNQFVNHIHQKHQNIGSNINENKYLTPLPENPYPDNPYPVNQEHTNKTNIKNKKKKQKLKIDHTLQVKILCPLDFKANEHHYKIGQELGVNVDYEILQIIDWSHSNGQKKLCWNRTFNNWLRNEHKFSKGRKYNAKESGAEIMHRVVKPTIQKIKTQFADFNPGLDQSFIS